jgi:predicted AAA+ superfamily ATPase
MIERTNHLQQILQGLEQFPVVALLGPRQVGKTTLARQLASQWAGQVHHFDLEDPDDQARLGDPSFALRPLTGLVVLDEIQTQPQLFPLLRVLADRPEAPARFLLLGSAAPELLRNTSESLAGRVQFYELGGLNLEELPPSALDRLWLRGGFPRAFLAPNENASRSWRESFIRTYLERDLPQLGINLPALTLRRFWTMLGHYHAQTWNGSELARALGVSDKTVSRYLDILEGTFMTRRLRPWHTNQGKREVKAPKVYLSDTGLLHSLLGITDEASLLSHPKCGASWEGFALSEVLRHTHAQRDESYFWALHSGAELDLLLVRNGKRLGFEVKLTRSPKVTPSMRTALQTLELEHLYVICHAPDQNAPWSLSQGITALPLQALAALDRIAWDVHPQ